MEYLFKFSNMLQSNFKSAFVGRTYDFQVDNELLKFGRPAIKYL